MMPGSNTSPKLNESIDEKLLSLLVDSVKDYAIFMLDPKGNIISWNAGAERIKGYTKKEVIGRHMSVFYTREDIDKNEPEHNLSEALKKESYENEGWRVRKDGSMFWANVVFTPLYDKEHHLLGFAKVTRDITERKKSEDRKQEINLELERRVKENTEKIISNELLFRALIENTHDGIVLLDENKRTIFRSKSAERINGWTTAELQQKGLTDLVHHGDKHIVTDQMQEALAQPRVPVYSTYRLMHKNGHYIWVECLFTNMLDDPNIKAIVSNFRDITDKKESDFKLEKTLHELIENEALLKEAEMIGKIGSVEIDLLTQKRRWSPGMSAILGYKYEETEQTFETFIERVHPDDVNAFIKKSQDAFKNLDQVDLEFRITTPDKVVKHALSRLMISRDENGNAYRANGFMQDITEMKLSEDMLKRSRLELQETLGTQSAILNALPPSIALLNAEGRIVAVNAGWKNFGTSNGLRLADHGIGYNYIAISNQATGTDDETGRAIAQGIKDVIAGDKKSFSIEYPCDSPGEKRWFQAVVAPLNDKTRKGAVILHINITDRKISEIKLHEMNIDLAKHAKELAISNAELEQFAYVASHDLQEPLRMVTSFLTQLEKKYGDVVDAKGKQYIYFAVDGAKRMRQIILDLLEFSRVGKTEEDLELVNAGQLLNEIMSLYKRQAEELGAKFRFKDMPTFKTFKTPLRQVFLNLIGNSLKYHQTGKAPVIEISCKETPLQFQFCVKDNGIGIEKEYFDKIFIIFQRLHNKEQYSGTGMGLAITKKIVENSGGKIWVESDAGKGSTFYFTIPKTKKDEVD